MSYSFNASFLKNTQRVSGMYSGMDTESLVKASLYRMQTKADTYTRTISSLGWRRDLYRDVNNSLSTFRNNFSSVLKQDQNMLSELTFKQNKVTIEKDSTAVGITAGVGAFKGSGSIEVTKLATAMRVQSGQKVTKDGMGLVGTDTLEQVAEKLNSAGTADWFDDSGNMVLNLGGESFTFSKDTRFSDFLSTINKADLKFEISYSQLSDTLTISNRVTGAYANATAGDEKFLDTSFIAGNNVLSAFYMDAINAQKGTDAEAVITHNGVTETVTRDTNDFTIDGIGYSLNRVTNEPVEFNVDRDIDKTVESIKKYVEGYNEIIKKINGMVTEKPNKKFQPLSDEERSSMTADQIKTWEDEAKKGMVYNDNTLNKLLSDLRGAFYTPAGGTERIMANIGLTTTSDYTDGGQIQIDEIALRSALESNPDEVYQMFAANATKQVNGETVLDHENAGLVRRVNDTIYQYVLDNEGNVLPSMETELRTQASNEYDHMLAMYAEENRLYAKYAAMETALSKLQSQTSSLTSLLTGLNNKSN